MNSSSHSGVAVLRSVSVLKDASFCPSITTSQNGLQRDTKGEKGGREGGGRGREGGGRGKQVSK